MQPFQQLKNEILKNYNKGWESFLEDEALFETHLSFKEDSEERNICLEIIKGMGESLQNPISPVSASTITSIMELFFWNFEKQELLKNNKETIDAWHFESILEEADKLTLYSRVKNYLN